MVRGWGCTEVLGHGKTALVLFGGWAFLGETVTARQVGGMTLAMCGMIAYGYFVSQCALPPPLPHPTRPRPAPPRPAPPRPPNPEFRLKALMASAGSHNCLRLLLFPSAPPDAPLPQAYFAPAAEEA